MTTSFIVRHDPGSIVPARTVPDAVHELLTNGWTRLQYGTIAHQFDSLVRSLTSITEDPDRDRYVVNDEIELDSDGENDIGLIIKPRGGIKHRPRPDEITENRLAYDDTKFTFHYKQRLLGYYGRHPGLIERHAGFFLEVARMHDETSLLGLLIAQEIDRQMPGYDFVERMKQAWFDNLLRLLRYLCDGDVPNIAKGHRDKCFITIHPGSDRGGFWLLDAHGHIIADAGETARDSVPIFLSRKAWEITRGRLRGVVHGVRDTTFGSIAGRTPRHTAVCFMHAEVRADERCWAKANIDQLNVPSYVRQFEMS
jgi:hypothetical protein